MDTAVYRQIEGCRSCGSTHLDDVLSLGEQALNAFPLDVVHADYVEIPDLKMAPIEVVRCKNCTLVQLRHTANRELLFSEYFYKSGTNESMVAALKDVVEDALAHVDRIKSFPHWLDIGANDGTLGNLARELWPSIFLDEVDPAPQLQRIQRAYFPEVPLDQLWPENFIITSIAQFYNVDDPNAYVSAIKRILHPQGVWVVQMQDLHSVVAKNAVDYFCHEHLCLYDEYSFQDLVHRHGLQIQDVSYNDVNGGSVRFIVGHGTKLFDFPGGRSDGSEWRMFRTQATVNKVNLRHFLKQHKNVGGLAASTKANTLLQFYGIGPDLLPWIADRDAAKVGRTTVTGIPIISEKEGRRREPDYLVCLAWHFLESFKERESAFLERGGKFILPLPDLTVYSQPSAALVA